MIGTLGEEALSAVSLANQFINIFTFASMGLGQGGSILITRFWGMRDKDALKKTVAVTLRYCMMISMIFTGVTICFPDFIMQMYIADRNVIWIREELSANICLLLFILWIIIDRSKYTPKRWTGKNTVIYSDSCLLCKCRL